ncbi:hypothetical protein LSH36_1027g01019 [Paralvinella palmiformis]|uniref:Uncharacterized protein n=1 Tax=Paralvinella palmiformis TaxID=53620 RepID=A0AAD9MQ61_9ANNE|nr:hypothetical protein LSH36_1027g01019 [Paralvinella palmiformis]
MKVAWPLTLLNLLGLIYLCQLPVYTRAQLCVFPSAWQAVWFTHYDIKADIPWVYAIGPATVIQYASNSAVELVYQCNSTYRPTNDVLYYIISISGFYFCVQASVIGDAMIVKQTDLTDKEANLNANDCPLISRDTTFVSWYIRYPYHRKGVQCPFPKGHYQAVYWQKPTELQCEGDPFSEIIISDNTLSINTCFQGNVMYYSSTAENTTTSTSQHGHKNNSNSTGEPFYSDLTCVATWKGDYLDPVNGQRWGDYLLLSYADVNSLVRYMCALDNGRKLLNADVTSAYSVELKYVEPVQ